MSEGGDRSVSETRVAVGIVEVQCCRLGSYTGTEQMEIELRRKAAKTIWILCKRGCELKLEGLYVVSYDGNDLRGGSTWYFIL
jgi:hypothetical protein